MGTWGDIHAMLRGSKLKSIALCVILALCLHSTEGDVSDQNQAVSHTEKGRGGFLAATGSFRLSGLVPREEEGSLGERNVAELDSADDLLVDDDQFETDNTHRRRRTEQPQGDAQNSLKDAVSVQVSNFICTAKGPQCEGNTCNLGNWTIVEDEKICIKGDEETTYCLVFTEDDSDEEFKVKIGDMTYNYKATQERIETPSQGGTKRTTEMKPNGVQAVIATTAAPEGTDPMSADQSALTQSEGGGQCFFTMQHRKIGIPLTKEADEDAEEDVDADADEDVDADAEGSSLQVEYVKLTLCKTDCVNGNMQTDSVFDARYIKNAFDVWRNKIELPTRYEGKECKVEKFVLDTQLCNPTAAGKECRRTKSNEDSLKAFQERCMEDEEGACPKVHNYFCGDCEGCKGPNGDCADDVNANQCGSNNGIWCLGEKREDTGCGACQGCQKVSVSGDKKCKSQATRSGCATKGSKYKWCGEDLCAKCTSEFKAFAFNEESEMIAAMVIEQM